MDKKAKKQEDSKPFEYFNEVKSAQKQEKPTISNLVTILRSDMVPASNVEPARESLLQQENVKIAVGIMLGLIILGLILFTLVGPGRPILEQNLASLAHKALTFTPRPTSSSIPNTQTLIQATITPHSSPTVRLTNTPVVAYVISPTTKPVLNTPTVASCRDALSITLDDVGKSLCVKGVVIEKLTNPTDFMVLFSYKRNAFYWVSYDIVWSQAKVNTCYETNGTIDRIGNSPMLVFDYRNVPKICP